MVMGMTIVIAKVIVIAIIMLIVIVIAIVTVVIIAVDSAPCVLPFLMNHKLSPSELLVKPNAPTHLSGFLRRAPLRGEKSERAEQGPLQTV